MIEAYSEVQVLPISRTPYTRETWVISIAASKPIWPGIWGYKDMKNTMQGQRNKTAQKIYQIKGSQSCAS